METRTQILLVNFSYETADFLAIGISELSPNPETPAEPQTTKQPRALHVCSHSPPICQIKIQD